ncbi:MAG: hypothetical protein J7500_17065 [Sphingomonas sp.]|uniref:hypothetical protein n=1 Tax=Sphingomonas sp. TaxID=28214 RepID=UPI001B0C4574|nr:hypothetical protein [Sphingomonas sp.]MBO9624421.1 hypothetical protein [Sphingomonas sp.]
MRRLSVSAAALFALAGCSEAVIPSRPAPPVPAPAPAPPPAPRPAPPTSADWRDWPLTPGTWTWRHDAGGTIAEFAGGELSLRCDRARGRVQFSRRAVAVPPAPVNVNVRTTSMARTLQLQPSGASLVADLGARDTLLDAIGYSRGRFVVEGGGMPTLVVPAWAETLRVIEDCRG